MEELGGCSGRKCPGCWMWKNYQRSVSYTQSVPWSALGMDCTISLIYYL